MVKEFEDVETNMLFNLIRMAEILMADIERRFHLKGGRFIQQKKRNYTEFINRVHQALNWFDRAIADDYWIGADGQSYHYDKMRFEANELIRLNLLYVDRVSLNADNFEKVFEYIKSLPSCGVIDDKDLEYFNSIRLKAPKQAPE